MNTNEKGNIGLAKAINALIEKNYFVFLPFTDTTIVDIIISNNKMKLKKAQVKYIKINKRGAIVVPFQTVVNGKKINIDKSKIDIYIIYCPDNNKIYYIDILKYFNAKTLNLRIVESKQKQKNIKYAKDFENLIF